MAHHFIFLRISLNAQSIQKHLIPISGLGGKAIAREVQELGGYSYLGKSQTFLE